MTKEQLHKFIKIRNKSSYRSNLQFNIDANEVGINLRELGEATRTREGDFIWKTPFGILKEHHGRLQLEV